MRSKLLLLLLIFTFWGCNSKKSLKIGYIANLSGRHSDLGIKGRDGFLMAIDEFVSSKESKNFDIEVIIKDHKGDKNNCFRLTNEMVLAGVEVIIGPLTSSMAEPVINGTLGSNTLILSPTVSSDKYTEIDDNFIRFALASSIQGKAIGELINIREEKNIVVIADRSNIEYVEDIVIGLNNTINTYPNIIYFDSKKSIPEVISKLIELKSDAYLFIAPGIDTALILQNLKKQKEVPSLYGASWVKVTNIATHGGKVVEGMVVVDHFSSNTKSKYEKAFIKKFNDRYNIPPNLPAVYTYESTNLFLNIKKNNSSLNGVELKGQIVNSKEFQGVYDNFSINRYGDVNRKYSLYIIKDGRYEIFEVPK